MRNHRYTGGLLHAHIAYHASDCDGPIGRDWVEVFNTDEAHQHAAHEFAAINYIAAGGDPVMMWRALPHDGSEHQFRNRVLTMCISYYVDPGCQTEVRLTNDGFHVDQGTDEGYSRYEVEWCEERCNAERRGAYDRFAEMMGY